MAVLHAYDGVWAPFGQATTLRVYTRVIIFIPGDWIR